MVKISSIVDVPKKADAEDLFGINKYENGLTHFIQYADTPITIAIQGEWGSGKTSLMNSLQRNLCHANVQKGKQELFYDIWINTWQYSLLRDPEETLISILGSISTQIAQIIQDRHQTVSAKLSQSILAVTSKLLKGGVGVAVETVAGGRAADVVGSLFEKEESNKSLQHLRTELECAIETCLIKDQEAGSPKKGFIFFIDDLDRIDPPVAVQILELLKNIFDLPNCIFVLAIDYDVVIKGLKPKFGELTESNEREFRSFFDKIIQMPFSMPVANYQIDHFLIENLKKIGFISGPDTDKKQLAETLTTLCQLSVGSNPRSLKRLLNTVSLITIIGEMELDKTEEGAQINELALNFGLICTQIAYPQIYKVLSMEGNFKNWNETIATKLNLKTLQPHEIEKLNSSDEFDEEWEKIVYRICEKDAYLRSKAVQVSTLLNTMARLVPEGADLGDTIEELLSLSSVTDVQAFDKPKAAINKGPVLKNLSSKLLPLLRSQMPSYYSTVRQQSKKVQSNVYISYSPINWKDCVGFTVNTGNDKVNLHFWYHPTLFKIKTGHLEDDLKNIGLEKEWQALSERYSKLAEMHPQCTFKNSGLKQYGTSRGYYIAHINFMIQSATPDELLGEQKITHLSECVTQMMIINHDLNQLFQNINQ